MLQYAVIETDQGLTVAEVPAHGTAEEAASSRGGLLVDSCLYETYEDALDAMMLIAEEEEETP